MKKLLLSLILMGVVLLGKAQITITQSDVAPINTLFKISNDTLPTLTPGSAGASQTWNFTAAHHHTMDTVITANPSSTPYGTNFPTANYCLKQYQITKSYMYILNNADSLALIGYSSVIAGVPATVKVNPSEKLMNFPSTYLSTYTNIYKVATTQYYGLSGIDSIRYKETSTVQSNIDAYGSITLGIGTYNCLRKHDYTLDIDTAWGYIHASSSWMNITSYLANGGKDTTSEYTWWTNGIGYSLADMTVKPSSGAAIKLSYLDTLPGPVGIHELADNSIFNIYPNPANNEINVEVNSTVQNASIEMYDINGSLILTENVNPAKTKVNIQDLASGMYYIKLKTENGIAVKKFIKE